MIDYWLILCQLVHFTQVVLLTAMEYLREEEPEKEENKQKRPDSVGTLCEESSEPEAKAAWDIPKKKRSGVDFVPMLMVIGKFHIM